MDDPTTTKRSPLNETPASLQRLRQAITEEVGERPIIAAVRRLRNMQVCDHGPSPHVASERRQRQVQEFEGFCADKGAQSQCCQYDCAGHEKCHGALALIHGGVLRCLGTKNILVQQTTTPKQPPLEKLLEDLIHKQAQRRYWYEKLTAINHVAAKEIQHKMEQAQAEITLHQRRQSKNRWDFTGSMRRRRMNKKHRTQVHEPRRRPTRVQKLRTYSTRIHKSRKRLNSVRELRTRRTGVHQSRERQTRVLAPRTCLNSTWSTQCADAIITPKDEDQNDSLHRAALMTSSFRSISHTNFHASPKSLFRLDHHIAEVQPPADQGL